MSRCGTRASAVCAAAVSIMVCAAFTHGADKTAESASPIQFTFRAIPFTLDSSETPLRHAPETMAGGVAVFDFNNDGHPDIFFTNGADITTLRKDSPKYSNRLFANDGSGNFTDVTEKAGLAGTGFDVGAAVGDYDNDGYEDLFVGGVHRNTLYHNNGDGTFTDVTAAAGLNTGTDPEYGPLWSVGGAWLDINNDGLLDLFVVNYLAWDIKTERLCPYQGHNEYCHPKMYKRTPNQVFLNLGKGKFKDVSAEWGVRAHPGKGMGVGVADYDLDGWPDVFVANDKVYNSLFHNKGGKFEEVAFYANVALPENAEAISGMGVDFRDLDNDGLPDIALVALDDETFPIFKNTGRGEFIEVTRSSDVSAQSLPMAGYSPTIFDFDNDGLKDLFVSRGHVQSPLAAPRIMVDQQNSVFRNLGGMKFRALTAEAGLTARPPSRHRGSAVADFDGDGRMDVVVSALAAPAEIWMNKSPGTNHWLAFRLEGTRSNRDGIGARIKVVTKAGAQYNHMTSACGYASSSGGPVHFGLGPDAAATLVEIRWPSGTVQTLTNVAADRVISLKEAGKMSQPRSQSSANAFIPSPVSRGGTDAPSTSMRLAPATAITVAVPSR